MILTIDLSHNRLEGARAGHAIAKILSRRMIVHGGEDLREINLFNNRLGDSGFSAINNELLHPESFIETLNIGQNHIEEIRINLPLDFSSNRIYSVTNLVLDGNEFKAWHIRRLAILLAHATPLSNLSMKNCKLQDHGLVTTFEELEGLRRLKTIDYSGNNIFNSGLIGIAPFIGSHPKSLI